MRTILNALARLRMGRVKCPRCRHHWKWHADGLEAEWFPECLAQPHCICTQVRPS